MKVIGIMVKRGSVEDQGEDRGRLLTEVEQLISSGDNTMVSAEAFLSSFLLPTVQKTQIDEKRVKILLCNKEVPQEVISFSFQAILKLLERV